MSRFLYFDLQAVAAQAQHAVLADRSIRTRSESDSGRTAEPALWFYRHLGQPRLASNGCRNLHDMLPPSVTADNQLTSPAVLLPHVDHPQRLPLLDSAGPQLMDLLTHGLTDGAQWVMVDPNTHTVGVGRRRLRHRRTPR
ncbi:hypothetical protein ACIBTZ_30160 [Micromonospora sp. NPDC049460]|uniref:hypothetical protein n=1 Tax=Micromonospora sp. NPDC049460 TaxID=3364272 RepID=UPI0037B872FD